VKCVRPTATVDGTGMQQLGFIKQHTLIKKLSINLTHLLAA